MKFSGATTWSKLIRPFMMDLTFCTCANQGKAMFLWTSYMAQSPRYDDLYPLQRLDKGLKFNKDIEQIFWDCEINATVVDWLNFTTGAMNRDGLHYAAQIIFFRAQHFVAPVDLLWNEKRFF